MTARQALLSGGCQCGPSATRCMRIQRGRTYVTAGCARRPWEARSHLWHRCGARTSPGRGGRLRRSTVPPWPSATFAGSAARRLPSPTPAPTESTSPSAALTSLPRRRLASTTVSRPACHGSTPSGGYRARGPRTAWTRTSRTSWSTSSIPTTTRRTTGGPPVTPKARAPSSRAAKRRGDP